MSLKSLEERRKALEDEFFHRQSKHDLSDLRDQLVRQTSKEELRQASGMTDDGVLDKLVNLGISAETVMALSLVPLVHVAWADDKVQAAERSAILQGAEKKGIAPDTSAYTLLESWLEHMPDDSLFAAWSAYIKALGGQLNQQDAARLRQQVVRFARFVAEAAGGFLGIGKISAGEEAALAQIDTAFDAMEAPPSSTAEGAG